VCVVKAISKSFWKQSYLNVDASVVTLGNQNKKTARTDESNKKSEFLSQSMNIRRKLSQYGMKIRRAAPFEKARMFGIRHQHRHHSPIQSAPKRHRDFVHRFLD